MRCRLYVCGCLRCRTFADLLTWPCCSIVNRLPKSAMVVVVIAPFRDVIITCWTSSCKWNRFDVKHLIIIRNSRVSLASVLSESSIYFWWIWSTRPFQSWSRTKPWIVCPVTVPSSHFSSLWKFERDLALQLWTFVYSNLLLFRISIYYLDQSSSLTDHACM